VVPLEGGRLAVGVGRKLQLFNWANFSSTLQRSPRVVTAIEQDKPGNRFNDGKADRNGRIWIGWFQVQLKLCPCNLNAKMYYYNKYGCKCRTFWYKLVYRLNTHSVLQCTLNCQHNNVKLIFP
jgi:sugar lactone lactonase YvrE